MLKKELTEEIIASIKTANPDKPLFKKTLGGQDFVFTFIDRTVYRSVMSWIEDNPKVKVSDVDEKIVDKGLLWPEITPIEWMTMPAGTIPTLASLIQEKSYLATDNVPQDWSVSESLVEYEDKAELTEKERATLKGSLKTAARIVTINNKAFVIRPMLRPEYSYLMKLPKEADSELEGVTKCVVWPKTVAWDKMEAGVATVLATEIMKLSGFGDSSEVEEL